MQDSHDRSIRTRLLNMQDKDKEEDVTLERMIVEAERILQIERDSGLGSRAEACVVQTNRGPRSSSQHHRSSPQQHQPSRQRSPGKGKQKKPRTACWLCGGLHYVRLCSLRTIVAPDAASLVTMRATVTRPRRIVHPGM